MSLLLIALGMGAIAWADIPRLIKEKEWRVITAYSVFWVIGLVLACLIALDVPMPVIGSYIAMATRAVVGLFTGGGSGGS